MNIEEYNKNPKEVSDKYKFVPTVIKTAKFHSGTKNIVWHKRGRWAVSKIHNGIHYRKSFSVQKYGFDLALQLAINYLKELVKDKIIPKKKVENFYYSGVKGVHWNKKDKAWTSSIVINGRQILHAFPVGLYGFSGSLQLAINSRKAFESKYYIFN